MSENRRELLEAQAKHAADIERLSAIPVTESAATGQRIAGVSGLDEGVAGLSRVLLDELSADNASASDLRGYASSREFLGRAGRPRHPGRPC
jgi:hypothetical protein